VDKSEFGSDFGILRGVAVPDRPRFRTRSAAAPFPIDRKVRRFAGPFPIDRGIRRQTRASTRRRQAGVRLGTPDKFLIQSRFSAATCDAPCGPSA